jgi:hypothetical protein
MTGQWFYPVFTVVKSLSAKTKPDSCDLVYLIKKFALLGQN